MVIRRTLYALTIAVILVAGSMPSVRAGDAVSELVGIRTDVAPDRSVLLTLDFNGDAPLNQLIRSSDERFHVVLVGIHRLGSVARTFRNVGVIRSASFDQFANVGTVLQLTLVKGSSVRLTDRASELEVRIASPHGDEEAAAAPAADEQLMGNDVRTVFVPLSFADVSEVAGVLVKGAVVPSADAFNAQSPFVAPTPDPRLSSSSMQTQPVGPSYVSIPPSAVIPKDLPQGMALDSHIAVDRRLNAVIITGTPAEIAAYKRTIAFLDVPARSVLLDVQIVELTQNAARQLGIDYSPGGSLATASFGGTTGAKPAGSFNLAATLNALEDNREAKILAQPRILAINNHAAAILSGTAQPTYTTIAIPSGSGTVLQQQLQYVNVGVSLQILPRIAADGRVTTQIFSEVSTIVSFVQTAPVIATRQELTSAIVRDGDSLLVGGLLQENEIKEFRKIPGLGDLPLIGGFFRNEQTTHDTTNLYLIITPHVLSNALNPPLHRQPVPTPVPTPTTTP